MTMQRVPFKLFLPCLWAGLSLFALLTGCKPLPTPPNRVAIVADGERRTVETKTDTVRALLQEAELTLGELDRITPPETAQIRDGMAITITRVTQTFETITETLPFGRQTARDAAVLEGETRLLQVGAPGIREYIYRLTFEDGVQVERILVKDSIARQPVDEVLLVGTQSHATTVNITGTLAYLDHQDAWIVRGTTATRRRLTAFGDLDGRVFSLTPDGKRLLFTRAITEDAGINALWLIETAEAEAEALALKIDNVLWADWTPDGQSLAWTTAEPVAQAPGWRGRNDLWTARLNNQNALAGKQEILTPEAGGGFGWWGTRYAWSPTGDALAYARADEIGVVFLKERTPRPLLQFPALRTYSSWVWTPEPVWAAEGQTLASIIHGPNPGEGGPEESPVFDLWLLAASGAYSVEIASEVGMWAAPRFSPDGETLLFGKATIPYQSALSSYTLCQMDRDGSNRSCFFPPEGELGIKVPGWRWSPDARYLIFIYHNALHLLRRDATGAPIPITGEGGITAFDWR